MHHIALPIVSKQWCYHHPSVRYNYYSRFVWSEQRPLRRIYNNVHTCLLHTSLVSRHKWCLSLCILETIRDCQMFVYEWHLRQRCDFIANPKSSVRPAFVKPINFLAFILIYIFFASANDDGNHVWILFGKVALMAVGSAKLIACSEHKFVASLAKRFVRSIFVQLFN